ncbi:hypothetical protein MUA03_11760 [Enterobacteriaceae bacterium H16N7]|nr:hypothetical protein [Dryocola clanedunensis]
MNKSRPFSAMSETWNCGVSADEYIKLIVEQMTIERIAYESEIKGLRDLLYTSDIEGSVASYGDVGHIIYGRLLRYKLGRCGEMLKKNKMLLPYTFRRKFFKMIGRY